AIWINNHQMYVQRLSCMFSDSLHNGETKRDIGNENTVHNINVKPICFTIIDDLNILIESRKISCQNRRSYQVFCYRHVVVFFAKIQKFMMRFCLFLEVYMSVLKNLGS